MVIRFIAIGPATNKALQEVRVLRGLWLLTVVEHIVGCPGTQDGWTVMTCLLGLRLELRLLGLRLDLRLLGLRLELQDLRLMC